ncbi:glutamate synthase-related protein [Desulfofarcimen acetoxidans DSM 771]|jgi:glutamate synthase domain-containing protein 2|uniref:Glutamate synthase-related protein n=1 Tax=Desulfofarcimen acetoxidans (strain ATCC 49208 / DSM 771 / KCTC 5769 / VKM B-1644 / 5575) TaxID=485916 RepID=C8VX73_DESAS|nr:FMN-binding glutamate synthase family protein [Desulfofarcimen acetoxidans]ACV64469.1 glutamate synthase-related protein [Desulfofarcimen acetoxidans DSM 771]
MSGFSKGVNASTATLTKLRTGKDFSPSGMCVTCLDGCPGLCEIGKSAVRGKEVLYPAPFGKTTSASQKEYPVDYSHFNIMGTAVGAHGIEADSEKAIFPAVDISTEFGSTNKIKMDVPIVVAAMGSTNVAADNWDHLAAGVAICGGGIAIGENVCGMDPNVEIKNGRVVNSPNLARRVKDFQKWYNGKGFIAVQANVEDTTLGVQEYALEKLGVDAVELKWGQGAKDIGGEVKLNTLERALQLKSRGYIVLPNPEDPKVQEAYKAGAFSEFERHSRVGMVEYESFMQRVEVLRNAGAKYVFLKTGAYRPADLARAVKYASDAKLDLLTVDGAGGGTGMSPWRMMNEWGLPTVYIQALMTQYLDRLAAKGAYVPDVAIAGGLALEDHMFKGFAISAPYVKAIGMARSALTAAMVGKTVGQAIKKGLTIAEYKKYGESMEQIFVAASELKDKLGSDFDDLPVGAIGVYSYYERLSQGLRQFMCGARKFNLGLIGRDDIVSLTKEAAEITGISYIMDADAEEVEQILG